MNKSIGALYDEMRRQIAAGNKRVGVPLCMPLFRGRMAIWTADEYPREQVQRMLVPSQDT